MYTDYPEEQTKTTGKISHMEKETNILGKETAQLYESITELHTRLSSVLINQPESVEGKNATPQEMLVPAADKLRDIRNRVVESAYLVKSILSRLEV